MYQLRSRRIDERNKAKDTILTVRRLLLPKVIKRSGKNIPLQIR